MAARNVLDGIWSGAAILLAVWLIALSTTSPAAAHDPKHSELNDWLAKLANKHGNLCCNGHDTIPAEAIYDTGHRSLSRAPRGSKRPHLGMV